MHSTMCMTHKEIAQKFLTLSAKGQVDEAYETYAASNFKHHNPYFPGDARSLSKAMAENAREHPDKQMSILHALEDGDFVALHSRVRLDLDGRDIGLVHLFRFERDRIAELWDLAQPVPDQSPNMNGMF